MIKTPGDLQDLKSGIYGKGKMEAEGVRVE